MYFRGHGPACWWLEGPVPRGCSPRRVLSLTLPLGVMAVVSHTTRVRELWSSGLLSPAFELPELLSEELLVVVPVAHLRGQASAGSRDCGKPHGRARMSVSAPSLR